MGSNPSEEDARVRSHVPSPNVRNVLAARLSRIFASSPHRRGWLKPESRCLVPANSFAEYAPEPNPQTKKEDVVWFALNEDRPLFAFGGLWTEFKGDRGTKSKPIPRPSLGLWLPDNGTERSGRAEPVILTTPEE